jgi:hypothetical protein
VEVFGIVIIVMVGVQILSAAAGAWASYDTPKPTSDELANDKCAICKKEQEWHESLSRKRLLKRARQSLFSISRWGRVTAG